MTGMIHFHFDIQVILFELLVCPLRSLEFADITMSSGKLFFTVFMTFYRLNT